MSSVLWTSTDIAKATRGQIRGDWSVTGLSIDTRSLNSGELFIPLKDSRDGHEFIPQARKADAGAVMSERNDEVAPAIIVENTVQAMRDMAVFSRERSKAIRIAVTGSVGKTSLKEAIALICEKQGQTHKSQKSFNNHWGVPLTLASMPSETEYGVFELGMNHAGELADLSPLVAPHVAVITKIAPAHLAHFESVEKIAEAKAEIFEGLRFGGTAVLNADDDYYELLSSKIDLSRNKITTFGYDDSADVQITEPVITAENISATLKIDDKNYALTMPLSGEHWLQNAACAVATCLAAGIHVEASLKALSEFRALSGRGEVFQVNLNDTNVTTIDDSYNANPASMRAAIATLGSQPGRKIAVLGDMFELGKDELELHASLAESLEEAKVSRVIFVGECMRALKGALPQAMRGSWCRDWEMAFEAVTSEVEPHDIILVKGSNATGLSKLISKIKNTQVETVHAV